MTNQGTATAAGARDHARAQAGEIAQAMPYRPARSWPHPPDGVSLDALTWAETVAGGGYSSKVLARGSRVRLTDSTGEACAHVLLFNAQQPWERLNAADTVKVLWQAYLGTTHPLLSDQGRVLAVVTADSGHHHDALCGSGPEGRRRFVKAAAKHGLEPRDIPPSVSFFKQVRVEEDGHLRFDGAAGPTSVELRCELPVVMLIANVTHPLDPRVDQHPGALEILAWRGSGTTPDEPLWRATPELERAFENTADYLAARRGDA